MAAFGLAADKLIEVELVTADGSALSVTDDSHPDLMWALRGGGGNFGVAASLAYRPHPLSTVVGGLIAHPLEAARDVLAVLQRGRRRVLGRADRPRRPGPTPRTGRARSPRR